MNGSNTGNLILNWGFSGLLIVGNRQGMNNSQKYFSKHPDTLIYPPLVVNEWVTTENINEICTKNRLQGEIDLMSLDIDGNDYWIWKALDAIKPRVIVVEYNNLWGPKKSVTIPYNPNFVAPVNPNPIISIHSVDYCGASLRAFSRLGKEKGYQLIGVNKYGYNAFFISEELCENLPEKSVVSCFDIPFAKWSMENRLKNIRDLEWIEV